MIITELKKSTGVTECFFDKKDFETIGESGIYGAGTPDIGSPSTQVRNLTKQWTIFISSLALGDRYIVDALK